MQNFILVISMLAVFNSSSPLPGDKTFHPAALNKNNPVTKNGSEEKWAAFWSAFTSAIHTKDIQKIASLTSKDFYDGGGGTVTEWLQMEVFISDQHFNAFKAALKKGAKTYRNEGGGPYKATGKNDSGDLFFEYKNDQWVFAGVVGD